MMWFGNQGVQTLSSPSSLDSTSHHLPPTTQPSMAAAAASFATFKLLALRPCMQTFRKSSLPTGQPSVLSIYASVALGKANVEALAE